MSIGVRPPGGWRTGFAWRGERAQASARDDARTPSIRGVVGVTGSAGAGNPRADVLCQQRSAAHAGAQSRRPIVVASTP
jgi:hypothetical protein